jgi:hypothetical protein
MKKTVVVCAIVMLVIGLSANTNAAYVETFDSSNAGWLWMNQSYVQTATTYNSTGGNTDGYISCIATTLSRVVGINPTNIVGGVGTGQTTWTDLTDSTLTVDFKVSGTATAQDGGTPMVRFYVASGGTYYIAKEAYSWNPNSDISWTTHQIALLAENFVCELGSKSFADVIANADDIGLQCGPSDGATYVDVPGIGFAGDATLMFDNFGTIPEPATMSILAIGALALIRKK